MREARATNCHARTGRKARSKGSIVDTPIAILLGLLSGVKALGMFQNGHIQLYRLAMRR